MQNQQNHILRAGSKTLKADTHRVPRYIRQLSPYVPGKPIEETQREFGLKRVIKLASNENPLGPSPLAIKAVRDLLPEMHRYPDASAHHLKAAIASLLDVATQSVIIGNGSNEIIDFLVRTFCQRGDQMITSQAAFVAYKICAQIHGVRTLESPLTPDLRFDLGAMLQLIRDNPRVKLAFIANPNNPTGTYVNRTELEEFFDELAVINQSRKGGPVLVALDSAYWEYVTAQDLPDAMEFVHRYPNVVMLRTFSKVYGLAGFRVGYGVGAPEIIASLEKVRQPFNFSSAGLVAAQAALTDKAFVAKARKLNIEGMKFWEKELRSMKIPFWKSQGNFILADVQKGTGISGVEIYQACLKHGVIFRPVANYGLSHALRISVGTPAENRIAVRVLRSVIKAGAPKSISSKVRAGKKAK